MSALIETRNLKTFFDVPQGKLHAVDDVNLSIETGSTLGVVGESGCGKSTLGRTILGLIPATSGTVLYNGNDITHMSKKEYYKYRTELQIIFQDPYSSLNPRMSITQIVEEPLKIYNVYPNKEERMKVVNDLLDTVGLDRRFASSYPHELDGGRRQRIGIARALALNPKFIVCDEPVSALDVSIQAQILLLIKNLQKDFGSSIILISHDLGVIATMAQKVAVMYAGSIVEYGAVKDIFETPLHPYTRGLLGAIPRLDRDQESLEVIPGSLPNLLHLPPGCKFRPRCPYASERCAIARPKRVVAREGHEVACYEYS